MSCRAYADLDLTEYLVDPHEARFDAFRAHYPLCVDCSTSLSRLTAMDEDVSRILSEAEDAHPSPRVLLAHLEGADDAEASVGRHLEGCAACRAELAAVRATEALLAQPVGATDGAPGLGERVLGWLGGGRRVVPALVAAALLVFAFLQLQGGGPSEDASAPRLAERPETPDGGAHGPAPETIPAPEGSPERPDAPRTEALALDTPEAPGPEALALDTDGPEAGAGAVEPPGRRALGPPLEPAPTDPRPDASALAQVEPEPTQPTPAPSGLEASDAPRRPQADPAGPDAGPESERGVTLLAALDPALIPRARPVLGEWAGDAAFGSTGAFRDVEGSEESAVAVVAPRGQVALTAKRQPTIYWFVGRPTRRDVRITITAVDGVEPIIEELLPPPTEAGLRAYSLARAGVSLERDSVYLFEVALVASARRPDLDVTASSLVRVVEAGSIERRLAEQPKEAAIHTLAEAGLWLDAFARSQEMVAALPGETLPAAHRGALLESAGLDAIARRIREPRN